MTFIERIYLRSTSLLSAIVGFPYLLLLGVKYGKGTTLFGLPIISRFPGSKIEMGNRVILCSTSGATALGVNHPVVLRTLSADAKIQIGDDVGISGGSICADVQIKIGARSMLGANVTIADTDFHALSREDRRYSGIQDRSQISPVIIEENVFLGTNVIVLKGVTIGKNSVIGAGSVVTHDIPTNVIAAGNPCKVLKILHPLSDVDK